jgi:hypothetical protein
VPIEFVKEFKYLGIFLDSNLNWKTHLNYISQKIAKTNGVMKRLKNFLPPNVLKIMYTSLILPYINYGTLIWGPSCRGLSKLQKLQKYSVRTIVNAKYNAHTEPIFKSLMLLKLNDILLMQEYKFMFKLENKTLPVYFMTSMFTRHGQVHGLNTRHATNFVIPYVRHTFARNSLRNRIPKIFNDAPFCIKSKCHTHSYEGFAKYVKKYLIDKYTNICVEHNCYVCLNS